MHVDDGTRSGTGRQVTFRTADQLRNFKSNEENAVKKHAERLHSLGVNVVSFIFKTCLNKENSSRTHIVVKRVLITGLVILALINFTI